MTIEQAKNVYMSFPEIASECRVSIWTAHNWANYHRYFRKQRLVGKPVVLRADFEKFKNEHPELINAEQS